MNSLEAKFARLDKPEHISYLLDIPIRSKEQNVELRAWLKEIARYKPRFFPTHGPKSD
jgi:hypothetical protein